MLKWTLRILGPKYVNRLLWRNNVLVSKENIRWLKEELHICGLDLKKLSDLPANLERLLDVKLEVTKRTKATTRTSTSTSASFSTTRRPRGAGMVATPMPTSRSEPIRVVVDSREQQPYQFDPAHVTTVRRALPAGDYSVEGYESAMAIERKSLEDFVSSVITHRERFARELRILAEYDLGCVVVEGSLADVLSQRYRSGAHPSSVFGATLSIIVDHDVAVFFCGDRQIACRFVEGLLCRYHQRMTG